MRATSLAGIALAFATVVLVANASCSATDEAPPTTTGSGGGGGATTTTTTGQGGVDLDAGDHDGPLDPDAACVTATAQAKPTPLDLVVLVDRSGSMADNAKWPGVVSALESFLGDPASSGIGVGLQLFPDDPTTPSCDYKDYQSLLVPIEALPANEAALDAALDSATPSGNTPMYPAVKGSLLVVAAWQDTHPTHEVVLVLASDGVPGSCGPPLDNIPKIAELIAAAYAYAAVETYVIAIEGTDVPSLDQLAAAGGTGTAFDVTADVSQFAAKMAQIRANAAACRYTIPDAPEGEQLDLGAVNVQYTPSGPSEPEVVPQADGPTDCGNGPGWYFDDPSDPTKIVLCPASCETLEADPGAKVDVLFGCATIVN